MDVKTGKHPKKYLREDSKFARRAIFSTAPRLPYLKTVLLRPWAVSVALKHALPLATLLINLFLERLSQNRRSSSATIGIAAPWRQPSWATRLARVVPWRSATTLSGQLKINLAVSVANSFQAPFRPQDFVFPQAFAFFLVFSCFYSKNSPLKSNIYEGEMSLFSG